MAQEKHLGIKNLYGKVEYYDDQKEILTEKERPDININDYLTNGHGLKASSQAVICNCYLFVKQPAEPKIGVPFKSALDLTEYEIRVRLNFKSLLKEAGVMDMYKPLVKDEN